MENNLVLLVLRWALLIALWIFVALAVKSMAKAALARGGSTSAPVSTATPTSLLVVNGPAAGTRLDLTGLSTATLGRAADCTLPVDDDFASAHHARLFITDSGWFIEDLASRNGTAVNGHRIDQPQPVTAGTDITIGQTTLRLAP